MKVTATELPGVLLIEPRSFGDDRGYFFESYSRERYRKVGVDVELVQDNISYSRCGALRGLHLQHPHAQGKLVSALVGEVYDVAVDVRVGSPTFGKWTGARLSADNKCQLYVPPGFAHGFCVLSETAIFHYKCSEYYHPEAELSVVWNDPAIGIEWPIAEPVLSAKDAAAKPLGEIESARLPRYDS